MTRVTAPLPEEGWALPPVGLDRYFGMPLKPLACLSAAPSRR